MSDGRTVIVLAAGLGKRMHSSRPKVLHEILGRPLLGHVLDAAVPLAADRTLVVVGHGSEAVSTFVSGTGARAESVLQAEQRGTGHAVRVALDAVPDVTGTIVVLFGDTPMLRSETLTGLVDAHHRARAVATVLTARVADPTGLGRIVRDANGGLARIVEQRDADPHELLIDEINSGVCAFDAAALRAALGKLSTDNAQGEEYLTDVFGLLVENGEPVAVHTADDPDEALGCNDRAQLADLAARLRDRINADLMRSGVTMIDPATTWVDVTVKIGRDTTIEPNVQLRGYTSIGEGARIGPDTTLTSVVVGVGASVVRTHGSDAEVGDGASVGPFAYLRPGTKLGRSGKIGTFVETKNADIGENAKVPHLTYVGDATIGQHANIGAGTIFANYDGVHKHHTTVGDAAFVGSDTVLIAPVTIADGSYVAAGSAIGKDVPSGALGVTRAPQRNIEEWVSRKRPGTRTARVAADVAALRAAAIAHDAALPPAEQPETD